MDGKTMGRNISTNKTTVAKIAMIVISVSLLTAACARSSDPPGDVTGPGSGTSATVIDLGDDQIVLTASLTTFDECRSLLDHLRSEYAERVGPWGFEDESWISEPEMAEEAMAAPAPGTDGPDQGSAEAAMDGRVVGVDYSGTNVQEAGVDEADLVKTDGRRIFAVSNDLLLVVDAATRQIEGAARLASGQGTELLLDGDDLLVIMNGYLPLGGTAAGIADGLEITDRTASYDQPVTVVQRVRVDGYTPQVVETLWIDGAYVSTRSVDGVARVVTRHDPSWSFPFGPGSSSEQEAEEANRTTVLASTLEDWLPSYAVAGGASASSPAESGLLPACENVYVPSEFAGFGVTTVMSLPVGGPLAGDSAASVTAPGDIVYATPRSLYMATSTWIAPELFEDEAARWRIAEDWQVAVHRFDLTDPARAAYTASGSVPGRIHNQFSLSEHDGHLRVVTTTGDFWWQDEESSSQVRVLRETGDRLVEVGAVGDIGRGERVQSVRFAGAVGYVVTFRQVDPFYTLDLADPENPAIVGELKIPGFSSYLHPISDDLILGVGFDADESTGAITGSKVSLFDVSDLVNPQELAVWVAPDAFNDAGWDHRAFLWWEPARIAVFGIANWADQAAEAVALRVEGGSLTEIGRINHTDPSQDIGSTDCQELDPNTALGLKQDSDLWHTLTALNVIACEPGESHAMVGFDCRQVDWVPENWVLEEARIFGLVTGDETLLSCEPGPAPDVIVRSMVIGDELWTLSYRDGDIWESSVGKLAASNLSTLERTALINLTGAGSEVVSDLGDNEVEFTAALSTFECGSLLEYLRSEYAERVGPWGFKSGGWHESWTSEPEDGLDLSSAEIAMDGRIVGVDYSDTNVREAGVDEADLIKTDGRRIFAVSNGLLLVVDAASRQIQGSARLASGQWTALLLDGDDLLVIMDDHSAPVRTALEPAAGSGAADQPVGHDRPVTVVQRVRVDGYNPRVVETLRIDGTYLSTRSVDGVAWVVTRHDPSWSFPFVHPQEGSRSDWEAEEANRATVLASTLEDWLPSYAITPGAGTRPPAEGGLLPACENVHVPSEFAGFGVTTVMSLPVGGPLASESAVSVTAPGNTVHTTPRSLYVATPAWTALESMDEVDFARLAEDRRDAIHRFDLTNPARAVYTASGSVPGRIHNQFSLSEHDGHLRVVTTTGDLWWQQSLSQLRVLREADDRLVEVGAVGDIGRGERVHSVRFTGDSGYVVTIRLFDPFYTLDLSDPENPAIVGELKIPGFSSYLHPISDDLILGVGFDANESTVAITGSKISLFDVSDLANPREQAVWVAPDAFNDASWDHRAFLWWEPAQMAVFGISYWPDQIAEAVALRVEGDSITEIGRINHTDPSSEDTGSIGSTDCRRLNPNMAAEVEPESELWHTLTYSDTIACEPGESPAIVGFYCWPVDRVQEEARSSGVVTDDETLFSCQYGSLGLIMRSLVIGDELWTLGYLHGNFWESRAGKLAASDLATLERIALIGLS